jgi:hypothetical protein
MLFYFVSTVSGFDGGNRTRNTATPLSYGRHPATAVTRAMAVTEMLHL